eukprot:9031759-Pyramimonas_sp.AAC.1
MDFSDFFNTSGGDDLDNKIASQAAKLAAAVDDDVMCNVLGEIYKSPSWSSYTSTEAELDGQE